MSWAYGAAKRTYINLAEASVVSTETFVEIAEIYDFGENDMSYTRDSVTIRGETKEDLLKWLRVAIKDIENLDVIDAGYVVYDLETEEISYYDRDDLPTHIKEKLKNG